jgi:hypothetical protein
MSESLRPQPSPHTALLRRHGAAVEALAQRLARLSPSRRDPEAFHLEKHTIASELRQLARQMGRAA